MNPCPCGFSGDPAHACLCTPQSMLRYRARVSGPLLDRIDMHLEVPAIPYRDLAGEDPGEPSGAIAMRVDARAAGAAVALRGHCRHARQRAHDGARGAALLPARRRRRKRSCGGPSPGLGCRHGRITGCSRSRGPSRTWPARSRSSDHTLQKRSSTEALIGDRNRRSLPAPGPIAFFQDVLPLPTTLSFRTRCWPRACSSPALLVPRPIRSPPRRAARWPRPSGAWRRPSCASRSARPVPSR